MSVTTTATTQYLKTDGIAGSFSDLTVGARVGVPGTRNADGTLTALKVLILVGMGGH